MKTTPVVLAASLAASLLHCASLAATITWDGGAGTLNWHDPANWSGNVLPGPADDVVIDVAGAITVVHSTGVDSVNSLQCSEGLNLSGGSLELGAASFVDGAFTLGNATLGGAGTLTLNGAATWAGGTMSGAGSTVVASGATLTIRTTSHTLSRTLVNLGETTWTAGAISFVNGIVVNNGEFIANAAANLSASGGFATPTAVNAFLNNATFTKLGAGNISFIVSSSAVPFENSGVVEIVAGSMLLSADGTCPDGVYELSSGATLSLSGVHTFGAASEIGGDGTLAIAGGTTTFEGSFSSSGPLSITGGAFVLESDIVASSGVSLTTGTIGGGGELGLDGTSTWNSGAMAGLGQTTILPTGTLNLLTSTHSLSRTLVNDGEILWSAGQINFVNGTLINNALFTASSTGTLTGSGGFATPTAVNLFENNGSFVQVGPGTTSFVVSSSSVPFENNGDIEILSGSLQFQAGGASVGGGVAIAAGASLSLNGTHQFDADSTIGGDGALIVAGGTTTFTGALDSAGSLQVTGGTLVLDSTATIAGGLLLSGNGVLSGVGTLTVDGASSWTSGTMSGQGTTVIARTGVLTMSTSSRTLGRQLVNNGSVLWSGGPLNFVNGTFVNNSQFTAMATGALNASGGFATPTAVNRFENNGTFDKQGAGTLSFLTSSSTLPFDNNGELLVQQGTLSLASGGVATNGLFTLDAGSLLSLNGGHALDDGSSVTGGGSLTHAGDTTLFDGEFTATGVLAVSGGNFVLESDITAAGGVALNSGTLGGGGELTLGGASTWTNATMAGAGTTIVPPGASLLLVSSTHTLGRTLLNEGDMLWTSGTMSFINGTLVNDGTFTVEATSQLAASGGFATPTAVNSFENNGLFTKRGPSVVLFAASSSSLPFVNAGTVEVETGTVDFTSQLANFEDNTLDGGTYHLVGDLRITTAPPHLVALEAEIVFDGRGAELLNQGNLDLLAGLDVVGTGGRLALRNGALRTISGPLANNGAIAVDETSVLSVTSNYAQSASGTYEVNFGEDDLGALINGRIAVGGVATLGGTIRGIQADGVVPANCDQMVILTASSIGGEFAVEDLPPVSSFPIWVVAIDPTEAILIFADIDLNDDNLVDGADLGILLGSWGPGTAQADLNCDGVVDGSDLGVLLGAFGASPGG